MMNATNHRFSRRLMLSGLAGAAALAAAGVSRGQSYPGRPVRIVAGYGAGSGADLAIRLVAEQLGKQLDQPVVIDTKPGGGNLLAARLVKDAPPDGYTLLAANPAVFGPVFLEKGIDGAKELSSIGEFSRADAFVFTSPDITTIQALVERGRKSPIRFASIHAGASMVIAMFAEALKIQYEIIPYKTAEQIVQAVVTGDVQATIRTAGASMEFVAAGKMGLVATLSPERSGQAPKVPCASEIGFPHLYVVSNGLWGPPGLSPAIVAKLNAELKRALAAPRVVEGLQRNFQYPYHSTPEVQLDHLRQETQLYVQGAALTGYVRN